MMTLLFDAHTTLLTEQALDEIAADQRVPCISVFQPTHRAHPDNRQDPIRFRNLVGRARTSLKQSHAATEVERILAPLEALGEDEDFWLHGAAGLAVLAAPGIVRIFRLERAVREFVVVAGSFHTKPLRRQLQSVDRYQVLALNLRQARLFQGNRDRLDELSVPGVPASITDALAGTGSEHAAGRLGMLDHGHGKDEFVNDTERFFRAVDRAVFEHCSRPSGLPLILTALPEHHHLFMQVSHNPLLMAEAARANPFAATSDLRSLTWRIMEPSYRARIARAIDVIGQARADGRASDDPAQVALAATQGRVASLVLDADRSIPARIDDAGGVQWADHGHPLVDDLLDDVAERVLLTGGNVLVLPTAEMPTASGLAAIFRY